MAEVITISGSNGFGASCPPGWVTTPNGNCGGSGSGYKSPTATALQNALRALGKAVGGDSALLGLSVDGVIGAATAGAVNRAFTTHIGAGQAPAAYRSGALSIYDVAQNATGLTQLINAETVRRGGSTTAPAAPRTTPPAALAPAPVPASSNTVWWILGAAGVLAALGGVIYMTTRKGGGRRYRPAYGYV